MGMTGVVPEPNHPDPDLTLVGAEHVARYEETGGLIGHDWNATSCLILHAVGRRSGRLIKRALIYGRSGPAFVVVGSKAGAPSHPQWFLNLMAAPDVVVQVRDELIAVRARMATGDERARLWELMIGEFPNYDDYQRRTDREIPVVVLDRR
jgi:deazaflavin-dependent oxidoreductase (nitroreductase family)